jgi:hypothetical protein
MLHLHRKTSASQPIRLSCQNLTGHGLFGLIFWPAPEKRAGRLNACPTLVRKLFLHGGAGGFACESAHQTRFSAAHQPRPDPGICEIYPVTSTRVKVHPKLLSCHPNS